MKAWVTKIDISNNVQQYYDNGYVHYLPGRQTVTAEIYVLDTTHVLEFSHPSQDIMEMLKKGHRTKLEDHEITRLIDASDACFTSHHDLPSWTDQGKISEPVVSIEEPKQPSRHLVDEYPVRIIEV